MLLEVKIEFSVCDGDWEVNVWDREDGERVEDLEGVFPEENDAEEHVNSLIKNKQYDVVRI
jgi:hypothetical protein